MASRTHEFITAGSYTRPSWLGSSRLVGKRDQGLSTIFPFFFFFLFLFSHPITRFVACPSRKSPWGKIYRLVNRSPICSEMMFDLVSTKRHGQPGLRTDRPGKVHFTISSQISLDFWRNNFSSIHALARVYFGRDVSNPKHASRQLWIHPARIEKKSGSFLVQRASCVFRRVLT